MYNTKVPKNYLVSGICKVSIMLLQVFSEEEVKEQKRLSLVDERESLKRLWDDQVG